MSIQLNVALLNSNDPEFVAVKNGTPEEIEAWEDDNGSISNRPGKHLGSRYHEAVEHTEDEYGGLLIDLSKIPEGTTHIVAYLL